VGRVETKMSFSVCANLDIMAKISFSVKNFAKSVQVFSFSLKSPTSKCFCENNYNFVYTANFCKLPRAFALFLHTFSRNILRKQVFSAKMYQISCHFFFISQNCSFVSRDVDKFSFGYKHKEKSTLGSFRHFFA
jgi:hypothetical protein